MRKRKSVGWLAVVGLVGWVALGGAWHSPAYASSNPIPFIEGISPVSKAPGSNGFTLTVSGANFESNSIVQWNGAALTTTLSNGSLNATVPSSDLTASTTASITVMNPGPPSTVSNAVYFTVTASTASVNFQAFQTPSTGPGPFQPAIADFNGDGKLDLAVSDRLASPGTVLLFLGNGGGSFQPPMTINVGTSPTGLATGDFNGDGIQDLAVINSGSGSITILFGATTNPFGSSTTTTLPSGDVDPFQFAAADFNEDGKLDLAVTCQTSGNVVILLGNGDGTFGTSPMSFGDMAQPISVAVADFNLDGKLDLAVTDAASNEVWILTGNGDGTFSSGTPYATATSPEGLAVGDFNSDGAPDLAVADLTAHEVSVLLNSGTGTFPGHTDYASSPGAYFIVTEDLNGDGILDLAVTVDFGNTFNVLLGQAGGTFGSALPFTAGLNTVGIAAADFIGDGRFDLAVTNNQDDTISLLQQPPELSFSPASLTFPNQLVGTRSSAMALTMTSIGGAPAKFYSILGNDPAHFIQTNNCPISPATLNPGISCTFSVTFSPTATGLISSTITLRDNVSGSPQSIPLSGTGTAPIANLSPASLAFPLPPAVSVLVGTSSGPQVVTLSNTTGTAPLTISSIKISGDYSQTNNCGGSVAAGSSCTINVTFTPTATGVRTGTLTVTDNSNAINSSVQTTSLTGTAVAPVATLAPGSLTFASQLVGSTSPGQTVSLTNAGSYALTITSVTVSGADPSDFIVTNPCPISPSTLAIGASCTITVAFKPTAAGTRTASLVVTDNSNGTKNSNQTTTLTGTAVAPVASLAPASLTYSGQAVGSSSAAKTVTLSNTGTATLTVTGITGTSEFVPSQNCVGNLNVGSSCVISVTFSPATSGSRTGTLTVADNSGTGTQTATLSGTGNAPEASFSPASLTFTAQGVGTSSTAQTITLQNSGNQTLTINSIAASGDFSETNTCGSSLGANGATCAISVTFKPSASGTRSGNLSVTDNNNNGSGTTQTLALTGTGAVAAASLSPSTLPAFASQTVGTSSAAQTIALSNTGAAALSITSITTGGTNAADFTSTNTCGSSVAAGASCNISVTFKPAAAGTLSGTLTVTDNNNGVAGSTQTVSLSGTGIAPAVKLSVATLTFASQNVGTTSSVKTLTITNSGTANLSLASISASGDFSATNACGTSLAPGAACSVTVMFKPTAPGSLTGELTLSDNASPSSQTVSLTGTGVGASASLAPANLTFSGELLGATSAAQTIKLTNTGNASLSVTKLAASGDFTESNTCPASLTAGTSCTVTVTFKPTADGARTGTVTLTDSATGSPQSVSLSGTGQDFSIAGTTTSASVSPGQTVTYALTLAPLDGLHQAISLACSGAPTDGSCTVTPGSVTPSGPTTVKVSVTTTAASALAPQPRLMPPAGPPAGQEPRWWLLLGLLALAGLVCAKTGSLLASGFAGVPAPKGRSNSAQAKGLGSGIAAAISSPEGADHRAWFALSGLSQSSLVALTLGVAQGSVGSALRALGLAQQPESRLARRRPALALLGSIGLIGLMAALALGMAACGGGGSSGNTGGSNGGTPAGTYNLTVTGTATSGATSVSHQLALTLNVQ